MNMSVVSALVRKDLAIMAPFVLAYWALGLGSVALVVFGGEAMSVFATILFVTAMACTGIHAIMQTVVTERTEGVLAFMMSLPITIREYTLAKVIVNMMIFLSVWITLSASSLVIFIGDEMPRGTLPFFCIILVALLLAYTLMLATSLVTEGLGASVVMMVAGNIGSQAYLWLLADLHPIRSVLGGPDVIWNYASVGILTTQLGLIALLIAGAIWFQFHKRDFIR
ncbi:MAG: ABC-2 transporter permease [Pseudomonadota bacterium]